MHLRNVHNVEPSQLEKVKVVLVDNLILKTYLGNIDNLILKTNLGKISLQDQVVYQENLEATEKPKSLYPSFMDQRDVFS